eukprot:2776815-Rhodomonas_salina.1
MGPPARGTGRVCQWPSGRRLLKLQRKRWRLCAVQLRRTSLGMTSESRAAMANSAACACQWTMMPVMTRMQFKLSELSSTRVQVRVRGVPLLAVS